VVVGLEQGGKEGGGKEGASLEEKEEEKEEEAGILLPLLCKVMGERGTVSEEEEEEEERWNICTVPLSLEAASRVPAWLKAREKIVQEDRPLRLT